MKLVTCFVQFLLFTLELSLPSSKKPPSGTELCLTPECIRAASRILSNLHPDRGSIDPCVNFDQYVCGGFHTQYPNKESYSTLDQIQDENTQLLKDILDRPYSGNNNSLADKHIFDMVVTNYKSCMNQKNTNNSSLADIQAMATEVTELFPVDDADYGTNKTMTEKDQEGLAKAIAYLSKRGIPVFGEFWTTPDNQNPDVMVPQFGPKKSYNQSDRTLPAKVSVADLVAIPQGDINTLLETILPQPGQKKADLLSQGILEFASAVAIAQELMGSNPNVQAQVFYTTTVQEAAKTTQYLVLEKVIEALAPSGYKQDRMMFQMPEFYSNVSSTISQTPKSTIQALMMVLTYYNYEEYAVGYNNTEMERWKTFCYGYVDHSLPWIASRFFLDKAYSKEKHDFVDTLTRDLQSAYLERTKSLDWIANDTKLLVQEKMADIIFKIGYPNHMPDAANSTHLSNYYSPINITDCLLENALSIRQWDSDRVWDLLKSPADRMVWPEFGVHSWTANARYGLELNHAVIPSGITQDPLYYTGAPSYISYSSIGSIVGHEMTHGFDTNGRLWNEKHEFKTWWDESSMAAFNNKSDCFVKQYSEMRAVDHFGDALSGDNGEPLFVNGTKTIAENIADTGGLIAAWEAWVRQENRSSSKLLPGLEEFSKEQLFYINFGQNWCSINSAKSMQVQMQSPTDQHAPKFARILGPTQNSKAFNEVWKCNRKPVCELW